MADAVRGLFEGGTAVGATDGELLERFTGRRDEGAFAALVGRHGPMVLRACRSALGDDHDAHDAFQATFLVLARKGTSLRSGDALGPWLHRVALRASGRARRAESRRRSAERRAASRSAPGPVAPPDPDRREIAAVVQEEVDSLPDPYRAAIVLCDLEGLTCEQAAARLGCPVGTVASRLARGRERLRERLRRRGLDPRAAILAPQVTLPSGLAESTATAAVRFLTSSAAPSGAAVSLAFGVLRAMSWKSLGNAAAVALALAASTSGVVALAARGGATVQEPEPPAEASAPAPTPPPHRGPSPTSRRSPHAPGRSACNSPRRAGSHRWGGWPWSRQSNCRRRSRRSSSRGRGWRRETWSPGSIRRTSSESWSRRRPPPATPSGRPTRAGPPSNSPSWPWPITSRAPPWWSGTRRSGRSSRPRPS
ncbi:RNA polymerase sigma factor [Paludisphaera soli]|uniref:RNA polymerase sigma factor n=1 Tax=Paludisphaera soli TaxID=2712865 RepID=UPI0013EBBEEE|nr:RNA polymerase sigma factor [Paludisphaera soli]